MKLRWHRACRCCGAQFYVKYPDAWIRYCDDCIRAVLDGDDFRFVVVIQKRNGYGDTKTQRRKLRRWVEYWKERIRDDLVPF